MINWLKELFSWWVPFSRYPKGWTEEKERDYQQWASAQPDIRASYQLGWDDPRLSDRFHHNPAPKGK